MNKKLLFIGALFVLLSCKLLSQLPTPIHSFTFDNTFANTTNTISFAPSTPLQGVPGWGYTSNRNNVANTAFECTVSFSRYLSAVIPNLPQGNNARSIAFWYKFHPNSQEIYHMVGYGTNNNNLAYGLSRENNTIINYGWSNDLSFTTSFNTDWNHYVMVYNGAEALIYRNGQLLTFTTKNFNTSGTTFLIGALPGIALNTFSGSIDDLKIYNVALTTTEVNTLYNSEAPGVSSGAPSDGLLAYYSFNNNYNSHNGNHNMTIGTGTGFTNPSISLAKYGSGLNLGNGTSVLENTSLASALQNSNFTVACWVNRATTANNYSSVFEMFASCFYRYNFSQPNFYEFGTAVLNWQASNPQYYSNLVSPPTLSQWVHMAIVYNKVSPNISVGTLTLYINGIQSSTIQLGQLGPNNIHQFNNKFTIGGGTNNNGTFNIAKCYKGLIDEFYVYNRVLSTQEISDVMLNANGVVLPSTLTNFTAQLKNDNAQLFWHTQTETNTSHFNIEYSNNARDYTTVGEVQAAGNSSINKQYSFSHAINKQTTHYYRLKMVDKDGSFTYSNVVKLQNNGVVGIELYPNPVKNQLNISYQFSGREEAVIRISTIEGKVVQTQKMVLEQQGNVGVDVSRLTPGAYVVEVITANNRTVKQVMKE